MRPVLLGDRYRLGPVIGVGGTGEVHRAQDERLGVDVAVKVLHVGAAATDRERMRREVEYLRAVQHPNLVAVLDGGTEDGGATDGLAWFAMELVPGPDLRRVLDERGPLSGEAVRRLLVGVLGALEAMHVAGLVHRDVTPANILLSADPFARWEAKLADLGVARRLLAAPLTEAGRVVGTAAYLSPEQVVGGEVGPATDVYALALVALEALTGRCPFPGSAIESATSRLVHAPELPEALAPEWRELLAAATASEPGDRPDVRTFRSAALALPEDAGLRYDPTAVAERCAHARRGRSEHAATQAIEAASTSVLPTGARTTRVLPIAVTTQLPTASAPLPRRRRSRRLPLALGLTAVLLVGAATAGSAALVAARTQQAAQVADEQTAATPAPTASASAAPRSDIAAAPQQAAPGGAAAGRDVAGPAQQADQGAENLQADPAPGGAAGPAGAEAAGAAGADARAGGPGADAGAAGPGGAGGPAGP